MRRTHADISMFMFRCRPGVRVTCTGQPGGESPAPMPSAQLVIIATLSMRMASMSYRGVVVMGSARQVREAR
ncbi:hypothetical protein DIE08_25465 [Burkholderia sp. Bp9004]|nr:hypothetical protein DIE08_25465 [Burkholderia sp. Bp9004]